ncbi:pilus assembly protein TadG-related protein [Cystobacter fuscus]|uniref:pilus assembly protein TadG-related protein n=1 Tax=Cystobacter fuscus TaxID=43 RepID=UPI0037C15FDE
MKTRFPPPGRPRGQALVLMSLTMLLLTLMVCVTLSFSMRVREKMEAQSIADLAAYSSAVATARTFNSIALMNRAQTGQLVALTATESLVSWTSMVRASLVAARASIAGCSPPPEVIAALEEENAEIQEKWDELDAAAGVQALNIQMMAWHLSGLEGKLYKQLQESVDGGPKSFATQLSKLASEGTRFEGELQGGATQVSLDELTYATLGYGWFRDMAMASRGYEFITRRAVPPPTATADGPMGQLEITVTPDGAGGGSTYWGDTPPGDANGHGGSTGEPGTTDFLIAEDHATVTASYAGCAGTPVRARASVRATDQNDTSDNHTWGAAGVVGEDPGKEKQYRHTLLPCDNPKYCPNVFVGGMAFNTGDQNDKNLWAQPKLFSLVQRDYKVRDAAGVRPDPWLLRFNFQFSPARTSSFDNRGLTLASGTDISVQYSLATGLAYYHRRGRWNEPPNLWNPFWRATLASADVDADGNADVERTVGGPAAQAYNALVKAGFKGTH